MIRFYEAAQWTVGVVRRDLPPNYKLATRVDDINEVELPTLLDAASVFSWASDSVRGHRERIVAKTDEASVRTSFQAFSDRFDDAFLSDTARVLVWFSGKDLLAGMSEWLQTKGLGNCGRFPCQTARLDYRQSTPRGGTLAGVGQSGEIHEIRVFTLPATLADSPVRLGLGGDAVFAHPNPQRFGDHHRAVGLLVVFEYGDDRSSDRDRRAVQRVGETGTLLAFHAVTDI
jgi:hypothetical protein